MIIQIAMKFNQIIRMFSLLVLIFSMISCKEELPKNEQPILEDVEFAVSIDKLTIASADLRIRHDGDSDVTWVYHNTSDLESDPDELIASVVADELAFANQVTALAGNNKSIRLTGLLPKTSYRLILKAIAENGELYGDTFTFTFRTQRDLDAFEVNMNWNIEYAGRSEGYNSSTQQAVELENFKCISTDEEPYIMALIKKSDYQALEKDPEHELKIRTFFEQYLASSGLDKTGWDDVIETGNCTWQEERLRHGDWLAFMVGVDAEGDLTGLYRQVDTVIPEEEPTAEFQKWLGTWEVVGYNDGVEYKFNLTILSAEANMWFTSIGWEPGNVYALDPASLPVEIFFDKLTGNAYLVSQYVTTAIDSFGTKADFYFFGSFKYGGSNTFVDLENSRIAEIEMINAANTKARVSGLTFDTTQAGVQMSFRYTQVFYYMTDGTTGTAISMAHPNFPFTMTKISE